MIWSHRHGILPFRHCSKCKSRRFSEKPICLKDCSWTGPENDTKIQSKPFWLWFHSSFYRGFLNSFYLLIISEPVTWLSVKWQYSSYLKRTTFMVWFHFCFIVSHLCSFLKTKVAVPQVNFYRKSEWTDFLEYKMLHSELLYTSNVLNFNCLFWFIFFFVVWLLICTCLSGEEFSIYIKAFRGQWKQCHGHRKETFWPVLQRSSSLLLQYC